MKNVHLRNKTNPYQYTAKDGMKFNTKADKEYYLEQLMEKRALQQEDNYRDEQDHGVPNWLWPDKDHQC